MLSVLAPYLFLSPEDLPKLWQPRGAAVAVGPIAVVSAAVPPACEC